MCLSRLDKKITISEGIGWKIFFKFGDKLNSPCYPLGGNVCGEGYPYLEWIKCINGTIELSPHRKYTSGFHIYAIRQNARDSWMQDCCVIRKVKFRNVVATGKEGKLRVIVAKEMMILKDKV